MSMARIKSTWNNHTTFWYNVIDRVIITFHIHVDTSHAHAHIIPSGWWTTIDFGYWKISHILSNLKLEWITKFELDIIRPNNSRLMWMEKLSEIGENAIDIRKITCAWHSMAWLVILWKKLLCVVFISETMSPRGRKIAEKKRHNSVSLSNSIRLREIDWKGI